MPKFVGISLSFCVRDILDGVIKADDVAFIVPNFNWDLAGRKPDTSYYTIYWRNYTAETVNALLAKLEFRSRPDDVQSANISKGIWIPEGTFSWEAYADPDERMTTAEIRVVLRAHA